MRAVSNLLREYVVAFRCVLVLAALLQILAPVFVGQMTRPGYFACGLLILGLSFLSTFFWVALPPKPSAGEGSQ